MPHEDWDALDATARRVLAEHDGVAKTRMFLAAGLTGKQVGALRGRGVLERPRDGWYVDPEIPWQGKHAVRVGGVLACTSAAECFGLPVPPDATRCLHVVVPENSARVRHHRDKRHYVVPGEDREVVLHWSRVGRRHEGWRTPVVDALLLLADCVDEEWWIAALDAALHRPRDGEPLLAEAEWDELVRRVPRRLRKRLQLVDARCESPIETLLRLGLVRRGIGPFVPQFSPDSRRFVDFLVGARLILEADGAAFHDPEQDAVRDASFRRLGYTVLRFTYDRIVHDLDAVLDEIEAALRELEGSS